MSPAVRIRQTVAEFMHQRNPRERVLIAAAAAVVLLTLAYLLLLAPALEGRAQFQKTLPALRRQAAQLQALKTEAATLGAGDAQAVEPMSRQSVETALTRKGIKPQNVSMVGDFAKVQLQAVSFPALLDWLADVQKSARLSVTDAVITGLPQAGTVDASLTLSQQRSE